MKRNAELYTRKGMILNTNCSCIFDAASKKSSTSYFALNYDQCNDGWNVNHFHLDKIFTKDIIFYNNYTKMEDFEAIEKLNYFHNVSFWM